MCPTLAVTTSATNSIGMGISATFVLVCSNFFISLLRNVIPAKIRIPSFVVVIATFVTVVQMVLEAYVPALYDSLGVFIPLIVVNCIILGRAEAFASKNSVFLSVADGLGMGLGFTLAITIIGSIRGNTGCRNDFRNQYSRNCLSTYVTYDLTARCFPGPRYIDGFIEYVTG